jgi:hypothetical protein
MDLRYVLQLLFGKKITKLVITQQPPKLKKKYGQLWAPQNLGKI